MNREDKLPNEMVWDGGHLSDVALTAIGDGQESIVETSALEHSESCERCAGRLGRTALLSLSVGAALTLATPSAVRSPSGPPWVALAFGLGVALVAAVPALPQLGPLASYAMALATRGLPVLARGGFELARSDAVTRTLPVATFAASALLVLIGWVVARSVPRRVSMSSSQRSMS